MTAMTTTNSDVLRSEREEWRVSMNKIPDLEKLESSIYSLGSKYLDKDHPQAQAVMYEETKYLKRKYEDYWKALEGFESCQRNMEELVESMGHVTLKSTSLRRLLVRGKEKKGRR